MKKFLWIGIGAIAALALVAAGAFTARTALAQGQPDAPFGGPGRMLDGQEGPMHAYVVNAFAAELGLNAADVEAALEAGTPLHQIALDNGVAEADLPALLEKVHTAAFDAAVANGVITREQADLMLERMAGRWANGYGFGDGDCPMFDGNAPQDGTGFRYGPGMMGGGRGFRTNTP